MLPLASSELCTAFLLVLSQGVSGTNTLDLCISSLGEEMLHCYNTAKSQSELYTIGQAVEGVKKGRIGSW